MGEWRNVTSDTADRGLNVYIYRIQSIDCPPGIYVYINYIFLMGPSSAIAVCANVKLAHLLGGFVTMLYIHLV